MPGGAEPERLELVVERVRAGAGAGPLSLPLPLPRSLVPELSSVFLCWTCVGDLCQERLGLFVTSVWYISVYLGYSRNASHIPPTAQARGLRFARVKSGFHPLAACGSSLLAVGGCGWPSLTWRPPE